MESLEFHIPRFNELPRVPLYKSGNYLFREFG